MKAKNSAASSFSRLEAIDIVNMVIVCLYLLVDIIPKGDAIDYNGPQWLYMGILNIIVILYLFTKFNAKHSEYRSQIGTIFLTTPVIVYSVYFAISGLSFFFAFNQSEFLVCYSRFVITFIGFINILLLLPKSEKIIPFIAQLISLLVFIQAIEALQAFFSEVSTNGLSTAIQSMKGDTGNKNIFSSSTAIKIPFVLYSLYHGKKLQKILNFVILTVTLYALFIANTRSTFVGVLFQLFIYSVFCIYDYLSHTDGRTLIQKLSLFIVPLIAGVLLAQITLDTQKRLTIDQNQVDYGYGSFTQRISSIDFSETGSSGRNHIWKAGWGLFKDHKYTGIGYGNWKICSIPYERFDNGDNSVSVHAHNDFLESFGETGILGGGAYLLIFLLIPLLSFKNLFSKEIPNESKILLLLSLIGLGGYFFDALFNFPMERATMQVYFVLLYALNINENYKLRSFRNIRPRSTTNSLQVYLPVALLLALPSTLITYKTWESMVVQNTIFPDINADVLTYKSYDINEQFPSIPNLTMWGLPISSIKGRYLINDKKFDEGVAMLDKVSKENPFLYYAEFLKGKMYYENAQYDSAYKYAIIAFDNRPLNLAYFGLLSFACAQKNDSLRLKNAFVEFNKYRKDPAVAGAWNNYLFALTRMKYPVPFMLKVADSALVLFPKDSVTIRNSITMHQMAGDNKTPAIANAVGQPTNPTQSVNTQNAPAAANPNNPPPQLTAAMKDSAMFYDIFKRGNEAFVKNDFKKAIDLYQKAQIINPTFYPAMENIGLSYFLLQDYGTAVQYLDKAIASKMSVDGKAEYFRGIALIDMGKRDEGCQSFLISEGKKYYDARRLYDLNCVPQPATPQNPPKQ